MKKKLLNSDWMMLMSAMLIIVAVVLFVWFFLHGESEVKSKELSVQSESSLVCSSNTVKYPFFAEDVASGTEVKIYGIFSSDTDKLNTVSLRVTKYYDDSTKVMRSEAENHGRMNHSFADSGYGADALGATYSVQEDKLVFSLYTSKPSNSDAEWKKYFLIDGVTDLSASKLKDAYTKLGFVCEKQN